jgi:hypothetical protein
MSLIDQALKANEQFAKKYDPKLGGPPQPEIAVVTCMDPRLSDLGQEGSQHPLPDPIDRGRDRHNRADRSGAGCR